MDSIVVNGQREVISGEVLSAETIRARVEELGAAISQDYANDQSPLVLIGVLRGAAVFLADLMRAINHPHLTIDFIAVSSYGGSTKSSGEVRISKDLNESIEGLNVILVEDIVDSGLTLDYLLDLLARRNPASVRVCSFLLKERPRTAPLPHLDYVGFTVPDRFVIGYGLDYAGRYRQLPYLGELELQPLDDEAAVTSTGDSAL